MRETEYIHVYILFNQELQQFPIEVLLVVQFKYQRSQMYCFGLHVVFIELLLLFKSNVKFIESQYFNPEKWV